MADTSRCLTARQLVDLAAGRLAGAEAEEVLAHLVRCPACSAALAALPRPGDTASPPGGSPPTRAVRPPAADGPQHPYDFLAPDDDPACLGRLGDYRVTGVLGTGGMGVVFAAEDPRLGRKIALKVLKPQVADDPTARERFLREARAMAAVSHDYIVPVYQVGEAPSRSGRPVPFLAMPLLAGESLEQYAQRAGKVPPPEAARIARQMAEGLAAAHAAGLVHRDVKPPNVWLEDPPGAALGSPLRAVSGYITVDAVRRRVKLLDFGLARTAGGPPELTGVNSVIGTPRYMSPEQALGEPLDARSDLFSLGAVLYRLLAGRGPFDADSSRTTLTQLVVKEPPPLAELAPGAPPALVDLVNRLLAKKPADRPASAGEVADELRAMEERPTEVMSVTPVRRRSRWADIAIVAAGLVALALTAWQAFRPARPAFAGEPVRLGVLFSQTGTMRPAEQPLLEVVTLAVDDLNAAGGLLGRRVQAVVADGSSDEAVFAREAERLYATEKVAAVVGCWTSGSYRAVRAAAERHRGLLVYPVQYEGVDPSPRVLATGAVPNQQLEPAVAWCCHERGMRRFFLVGTDEVYTHVAGVLLKAAVAANGGEVVGEATLALGGRGSVVAAKLAREKRPDVILSTINGDAAVGFLRALGPADAPGRPPVLSFCADDAVLRSLRPSDVAGDYAAWGYFEAVPGPANEAFKAWFRNHYGRERRLTDPMEAAWLGVRLWAEAARRAGSADPDAVLAQLRELPVPDAPSGPGVRLGGGLHLRKFFRVGRLAADGAFAVVKETPVPLEPRPVPAGPLAAECTAVLERLSARWGGRWSAPPAE